MMNKRAFRFVLPLLWSSVMIFAAMAAIQPPKRAGLNQFPSTQPVTITLKNDLPDSTEPPATATQTLEAKWRDICQPYRMEITGTGMGDAQETITETLSLPNSATTNWLLVQMAGRYSGSTVAPNPVTFITDTLKSITMHQPTRNSSQGYTFEAMLEPTGQVTVSVNELGDNKTSRAIVGYRKQETANEWWTSIGKTTNEYVYWDSNEPDDDTHTEPLTFTSALAEPTDLFITAVVIDNNVDDRPLVLEATAGDVTKVVTITKPTNGKLLDIIDLTLPQVATGTDRVTVTLHSPPPPPEEGDSLVLVGLNLSYQCPKADLHVTKTVNDLTPSRGDLITYTITVTNEGPSIATGVQITDILTTSLEFQGYTATHHSAYSNGLWTVVDPITEATRAILTITAKVKEEATGQIPNVARILAANQPDPDQTDNEAQVTITVTITGADLAITKTVDNPTPNAGDIIAYTITVTNNGPDEATGVEVTDKLPKGVTYIPPPIPSQGSYDGEQWTVGVLTNGEKATLTLKAIVDNCTNGKTITNTATVSALDQYDRESGNDKASVDITVTWVTPCYVYLPTILKPTQPPCHTENFCYFYNDPNIDWLISPPPPGTIRRYVNDEYQIFSQTKLGVHWSRSPIGYFTNYIIEVEAHWGDNRYIGKEYGLIFDRSGRNDITAKMYRFNINTSNKTYVLSRLSNDTWDDLLSGFSSQIKDAPDVVNILKVVREGNRIELYINGKYHGHYDDNELDNRPARVGLNVVPIRYVRDGDARFDNFKVCSFELNAGRLNVVSTNETETVPGGGIAITP